MIRLKSYKFLMQFNYLILELICTLHLYALDYDLLSLGSVLSSQVDFTYQWTIHSRTALDFQLRII